MDIVDWRLKRLYEYWLDLRKSRHFPTRRDIDPLDIVFVLGHVMLVDVMRNPLKFKVRLHGSEMVTLARYELTGKFINDIPVSDYRHYVIEQCKCLVETGEPLHVTNSRVVDSRVLPYEALWLPFSEDGNEVTMLLCGLIYKIHQQTEPRSSKGDLNFPRPTEN
jgi:hypothetical protein